MSTFVCSRWDRNLGTGNKKPSQVSTEAQTLRALHTKGHGSAQMAPPHPGETEEKQFPHRRLKWSLTVTPEKHKIMAFGCRFLEREMDGK